MPPMEPTPDPDPVSPPQDLPATLTLRVTRDIHDTDWRRLRAEFIPEADAAEQTRFLASFAANAEAFTAIVASTAAGEAAGFCEISVRRDYVNGCAHRPVLYLEGIYVRPEMQRRGIARALCRTAADWGIARGCREFASDVDDDNDASREAHEALGFREVGRVICFHQPLVPA